MDDRGIVLIYTFSPFPFGEAASNRIMALAQCIQMAGYKAIVLGNGGEREQDYEPTRKTFVYEGIEYRSYAMAGTGRIARTLNRNNILKIIKKHLAPDEQNRIRIVYATYRNYGLWLHYVLKRILHHPAVVDVTEWHSSNQFGGGRLNPYYWIHNLRIRWLIPRAKNIICITSYLDRFYKQRGCNTVLIPPQVIMENYLRHKNPPLPPVRLFYAGTAAKKDYLDVMLDGLVSLPEIERAKITLTVLGLSRSGFMEQFPRAQYYIDTMQESLQIVGRVSKNEVDQRLSEAHFLILMRPDSRYSRAGFPSKVPEAMAAGVPVITNVTSDLGMYIRDGKNGFIVDGFNASAFADVIHKVVGINDEVFQSMSGEALRTAAHMFDRHMHVTEMKEFLAQSLVAKIDSDIVYYS